MLPRFRISVALLTCTSALVLCRGEASAEGDAGAAGAAPVDPLAAARAAVKENRFEEAAELAIAAGHEHPCPASVVLGLARFRASRLDEALRAFETAEHCVDPAERPAVRFNLGSTLFKLGRLEAAERRFVAVAEEAEALAALALLNASLAALERGELERAASHAATAQTRTTAPELVARLTELRAEIGAALVDRRREVERTLRRQAGTSLAAGRAAEALRLFSEVLESARTRGAPADEEAELLSLAGKAALRAGELERASLHLDRAAELAPGEADFLIDAAAAALRRDDLLTARLRLEAASRLQLEPETMRVVRHNLDGLSPGLRGPGRGLAVHGRIMGGYDSNVAQTGLGKTETMRTAGGDVFAAASLELVLRGGIGKMTFGQIGYTFDQIAYALRENDAFNLQQHTAEVALETALGPLRAGVSVEGEALFYGLAAFAPFQRSIAIRPALALDEGPRASTRLELSLQWKDPLDASMEAFGGRRTDLTLTQGVRLRTLRASIGLRARDEDIGPAEQVPLSIVFPTSAGGCASPQLSTFCQALSSGVYVIPYAYRSLAVMGRLTFSPSASTRFELAATLEHRLYTEDSFISASGLPENRMKREDTRLTTTTALGMVLNHSYRVKLRYDLTVNRSNIDYQPAAPNVLGDYDNKSFSKHILAIELAADWL